MSSFNQQPEEEEEETVEEGSEYDPNEEEAISEEEEEGDYLEEEEDYANYEPDDIDEPPQQVRQRKNQTRRVLQEEPSIKSRQVVKTPVKRKKPADLPRQASVPPPPPMKKPRTKVLKSSNSSVGQDEVMDQSVIEPVPTYQAYPASQPSSQNSQNSQNSGIKKAPVIFNDGNVDVNLHTLEAQNIVKKKIKISSSLIVCSQIVENWDNKNYNQEYASITIQRKLKDGKAFEFNIPLNLAFSLQNAIQIIIDSNPKFFSGIKRPKSLMKKEPDSEDGKTV